MGLKKICRSTTCGTRRVPTCCAGSLGAMKRSVAIVVRAPFRETRPSAGSSIAASRSSRNRRQFIDGVDFAGSRSLKNKNGEHATMSAVTVLYHSNTGHTAKLAEAIKTGAASIDGVDVCLAAIVGEDIVKGRWENASIMERLTASDT